MVESFESQEGHPAEFENKIFRGTKVKQWSEGTKGREKNVDLRRNMKKDKKEEKRDRRGR